MGGQERLVICDQLVVQLAKMDETGVPKRIQCIHAVGHRGYLLWSAYRGGIPQAPQSTTKLTTYPHEIPDLSTHVLSDFGDNNCREHARIRTRRAAPAPLRRATPKGEITKRRPTGMSSQRTDCLGQEFEVARDSVASNTPAIGGDFAPATQGRQRIF